MGKQREAGRQLDGQSRRDCELSKPSDAWKRSSNSTRSASKVRWLPCIDSAACSASKTAIRLRWCPEAGSVRHRVDSAAVIDVGEAGGGAPAAGSVAAAAGEALCAGKKSERGR